MKTLNETFTDDEWEQLKQYKVNMNWHDYVMLLANINAKVIPWRDGKVSFPEWVKLMDEGKR